VGHRCAAAPPAIALLGAACVGVLAGCAPPTVDPSPTARGPNLRDQVSVQAGDAMCEIGTTRVPAGRLTFTVTNTGTSATAFVLSDAAGRPVGSVTDIPPGTTRQLVVDVPAAGTYTTACRPGQVGDGIRAPFTVTDVAAPPPDAAAARTAATAEYQRYLTTQLDALVDGTRAFAAAVRAGEVRRAEARYSAARAPYERIEPLVVPLGDLAARIDGQEGDERAPGAAWTGFHRLEKDLWVDGLRPDSGDVADRLVADVEETRTRVGAVVLSPSLVGDVARELLDDAAISKVRGDEDRYSHTDLADLAANVEGARAAVAALRPVVDARDPALGPLIDRRFDAVEALLDAQRTGQGFRSWTALTDADRKALSDAIDAVGEPVSTVAGVVAT
jgi:iron uptake system component EfeO